MVFNFFIVRIKEEIVVIIKVFFIDFLLFLRYSNNLSVVSSKIDFMYLND